MAFLAPLLALLAGQSPMLSDRTLGINKHSVTLQDSSPQTWTKVPAVDWRDTQVSGELIRRNVSVAVPRSTQRALGTIVNETRLEHAVTRAISAAGQQAMFDIAETKRVQRELEHMNPDAAGDLALIASTVTMAIARSVQRFGSELGG